MNEYIDKRSGIFHDVFGELRDSWSCSHNGSALKVDEGEGLICISYPAYANAASVRSGIYTEQPDAAHWMNIYICSPHRGSHIVAGNNYQFVIIANTSSKGSLGGIYALADALDTNAKFDRGSHQPPSVFLIDTNYWMITAFGWDQGHRSGIYGFSRHHGADSGTDGRWHAHGSLSPYHFVAARDNIKTKLIGGAHAEDSGSKKTTGRGFFQAAYTWIQNKGDNYYCSQSPVTRTSTFKCVDSRIRTPLEHAR